MVTERECSTDVSGKLHAEKHVLELEVAYLKAKVDELVSSRCNPSRMRKFRRLEHLFSRVSQLLHNDMLSSTEIVSGLRKVWAEDATYFEESRRCCSDE